MKILEPDILALLVGDFNVMPTALGVYKPERWIADMLLSGEVKICPLFEVRTNSWTAYAAVPRFRRYSAGPKPPSESFMRCSLYHWM